MTKPIIIVGGGAAGFFAALAAREANPSTEVLLLEKNAVLLAKVRVSGGGRCNVTHACFEPLQLVKNYPRGNKELIGPFTRFQPRDTIDWFASRGVELKEESDGRMFPTTDDSSTIIDCFLKEAKRLKVDIRTQQRIQNIQKTDDGEFQLQLESGTPLQTDRLLLATGSSPQGHAWAQSLGHTLRPSVPSLFTVTIPHFPLADLAGIAVTNASVSLSGSRLTQNGPLLITHWGFSGPAILKLSAWGARFFHEKHYQVEIAIDWLHDYAKETLLETLFTLKQKFPQQSLGNNPPEGIPKNLWKKLLEREAIDEKKRLVDIPKESLSKIVTRLKQDTYSVSGKTVHKEEFVTCGGVSLAEIDFKKMESRICKGLYFAGEILDIDAVTGGFNFQNAWTTGWLAGHAMTES